jgi:hypothetical protein
MQPEPAAGLHEATGWLVETQIDDFAAPGRHAESPVGRVGYTVILQR